MTLTSAVEKFLLDCKLRGLAESTIAHYKSDLGLLVSLARIHAKDSVLAFTAELLLMYLNEQSGKNLSLGTLHRRKAAVSQFSKWGRRTRHWADDPSVELPSIKRPKRLPRPFSPEAHDALMALELDKTDTLLRAVLFYTGLRATPVCSIRMANVSTHPVSIRWGKTTRIMPGSITVISKGDREHVVAMHPDLRALIVDLYHGFLLKGIDPKARVYLFEQPNGKPWQRKMVHRRVRAWGRRAGIEKCTPHVFRHTFATALIQQGIELRTVADVMNHQDMSTTALYTKVVNAQAVDAILSLPSFLPEPTGDSTHGVPSSGYVPLPSTHENDAENPLE